jgi:hypothetical protein
MDRPAGKPSVEYYEEKEEWSCTSTDVQERGSKEQSRRRGQLNYLQSD